MSTSRLVPFTVEFTVSGSSVWTASEWRMRKQGRNVGYGKATVENLKKHCEVVEASTLPGGCNDHLGVTEILSARIIDQRTGDVLATYKKGVS